MALSAGTRLGPYEILAPLGAGGMGEVYRARDPRLKRDVALKVLPEEVAQDRERLERFEREAQTLGALSHPHIVTIYSVEEAEGIRFLTMELVEGETLSRAIPRGGLPLARFFRLAIPLSEAVSAAHEKGITHRDLKPGNVMVGNEDRIKVLDFGLSKLGDAAESTDDSEAPTAHATEAGRVLGTAPYMSPEQVRGDAVDYRSDVFSLGIMLYEMATGERPFEGDNSAEVSSSILRDTPPSVLERKADLPRDLGRVIKHCLEKEPRKRFQSALDLANELEELKGEVDSGEASPASRPSARPESTRGRSPWLLVGAAVVALGLGTGYILTRTSSGPEPAGAATTERKRLVVLPFENLGSSEDAFFAAGMTEEVTSRLARVSGLGVISRTSATQYNRTGKTTKQIGADLGVGFLLEGTVRWDHKSDGSSRVRITPQLIRVADDTHLWADSYDRVLDDVFEAQSEIAQAVVNQLGVTLLPHEEKSVGARPTESLEAYNLYLRGQFTRFSGTDSIATVREASEQFRKATEADPQFALAYAALAESYSWLAGLYLEPVERAEAAVEKALALDESLADAHVAKGAILQHQRQDWAGAEEAFKRAIELNPDHWNAHREYGWLLRRMGRYDEAVRAYERAHELDPVSWISGFNLGEAYLLVGQPDRAIDLRRTAVELYPQMAIVRAALAEALAVDGQLDEALAELPQIEPSETDDASYLHAAGYVHALAGDRDEALRYVERLAEIDDIRTFFFRAGILTGLGEYEGAFDLLEQDREDGVAPRNLNAVHWSTPLREHPRYTALVGRVGLAP